MDENDMAEAMMQSVFNLNSEMLNEWFIILAQENALRIRNVTVRGERHGYFKKNHLVELVFQVCEASNQPTETRYLAVEIFDRFMQQHILDLYNHAQKLDPTRSNRQQEWESILERVKLQIPLRLISSCQIASKFTANYSRLSSRKVLSALKELGHKYSLDGIIRSELRILKTLDYCIMISTPLLYIETLLSILARNDVLREVEIFRSSCVDFLDIVYINKKEIYERFLLYTSSSMQSQSQSQSENDAVFALENDCFAGGCRHHGVIARCRSVCHGQDD